MRTAVVLVTVAINAFSGIAALLHWKPILPGMVKAGVPETWLTFPIGTLKTAGAAGLLAGLLIQLPTLIAAAAIGLVLFFVCALYTHVRVADYTAQFFLAVFFLGMACASLVLTLAA
ncbi:DoxX family protein [Kribbella sp. C-35]|uniref:DoxX family protein n=1 Tax=Kribbella sp. C-35 TaxID=2789276 RepID=UPI0039780574